MRPGGETDEELHVQENLIEVVVDIRGCGSDVRE